MRGAVASQMAQTAGGQSSQMVEQRRNQLMDQGVNMNQAAQQAVSEVVQAMSAIAANQQRATMGWAELRRVARQVRTTTQRGN